MAPITQTKVNDTLTTQATTAFADKVITADEASAIVGTLKKEGADPAKIQKAMTELAKANPALAKALQDGVDAAVSKKLVAAEKAMTLSYTLPNGSAATSRAFFRMVQPEAGDHEQALQKVDTLLKKPYGDPPKSAKERDPKIYQMAIRCTMGRGTPAELQKVTQGLIDAGAFDELAKTTKGWSKLSDADKIRTLQSHFDIGIDCNGACRVYYEAIHGTPTAGDAGGEFINSANRAEFDKITMGDFHPGDVFQCGAINDIAGHWVTVTKTETLAVKDVNAKDLTPAAVGPLKVADVSSSWGGGGDPLNARGGPRSETWVYDEGAKRWGSLDRSASPPKLKWGEDMAGKDDRDAALGKAGGKDTMQACADGSHFIRFGWRAKAPPVL